MHLLYALQSIDGLLLLVTAAAYVSLLSGVGGASTHSGELFLEFNCSVTRGTLTIAII